MACRTARPKRELVRVVRTPDGRVILDTTGRRPGRGAYLCRDAACRAAALAKGTLTRALGVPLPADVRAVLEEDAAGLPADARPTTTGTTPPT